MDLKSMMVKNESETSQKIKAKWLIEHLEHEDVIRRFARGDDVGFGIEDYLDWDGHLPPADKIN